VSHGWPLWLPSFTSRTPLQKVYMCSTNLTEWHFQDLRDTVTWVTTHHHTGIVTAPSMWASRAACCERTHARGSVLPAHAAWAGCSLDLPRHHQVTQYCRVSTTCTGLVHGHYWPHRLNICTTHLIIFCHPSEFTTHVSAHNHTVADVLAHNLHLA
jgi:hypothetical protein